MIRTMLPQRLHAALDLHHRGQGLTSTQRQNRDAAHNVQANHEREHAQDDRSQQFSRPLHSFTNLACLDCYHRTSAMTTVSHLECSVCGKRRTAGEIHNFANAADRYWFATTSRKRKRRGSGTRLQTALPACGGMLPCSQCATPGSHCVARRRHDAARPDVSAGRTAGRETIFG